MIGILLIMLLFTIIAWTVIAYFISQDAYARGFEIGKITGETNCLVGYMADKVKQC